MRPTPPPIQSRDEVLDLLREAGALLRGHFRLTSGLHSDTYLEKFALLQYPPYTEALGAALARRVADMRVEIVVGPAVGAILLSYEVARQLGTRGIFAEREGGRLTLRRGFRLSPGERTLVVEDVITTGGSAREVVQLVQGAGAVPVAVGALVDRSGGTADLGAPLIALADLNVPAWTPETCPLCRQGIPLTERGSRHAASGEER